MNATLFEQDAPCYASTSFPEPRPFQKTAHDSLRKGLKAGHKNQLIMAPTAAGKTYLGLRIAHEALLKGRRVIFVCDRTTLINQTSEAADKYGLSAHGIIQANHWRFNPEVPFQIASAQTLKNRGWPDADVIIIDEAHTQLSVWTEHIKTCSAANIEIERLAPPFQRIVSLEYFDRRPQKTKAEVLKIPRQVFSQRLLWIHEQLAFAMFGEELL